MLDRADPPAFDGIALLRPPRNAFPQHFHVPVPALLEERVGQTGLMSRARSVEDDEPLPRDLAHPSLEVGEGNIDGPLDMGILELGRGADVDDDDPRG